MFLNKKKSISSTSSNSSTSSSELPHSNNFKKFDEKKDYVKRCKNSNKKCPTAMSFCLSK